MPEATVGHMVEPHFDDQLWPHQLPVSAALRAPAAWAAWRLARETWRLAQSLELARVKAARSRSAIVTVKPT